ncbi:MAG: LPS export ABC transporter periplasmic protein LptC [Gammaproteobacteria bacterium]|nr:MAG: LPS export ABC transporter periplasmic protein LptC [Gammaproteobacteria bacterium]
MKKYIFIVLAILIVYGINQFLEQLFKPSFVKVENKNAPDYFFNNFSTRMYDETGKLNKTIKSPMMYHYRNKNATMDKPLIKIQQNDTNWQITAENATINKDNTKIKLKNMVKIINNLGFELSTQQISIDEKFIKVDEKLSVRYKNNNIVANSMLIDTNNDIITFNKVRGNYTDD